MNMSDIAGYIGLPPVGVNYPYQQPTVITNVFGDLPTPQQNGTWTVPDPSIAYQRFDQLNPPLVPPSFPSLPSLPSLSNIKSFLAIGAIIVVVLLLFKK